MRRAIVALVALTASCSSCAQSHPPATFDAGVGLDAAHDAAQMDARDAQAPVDAGIEDAYRRDGPTDCSYVAGYRRCGETCPDLCPGEPPLRCSSRIPLCIPPQQDDACSYSFFTRPDLAPVDPCQQGTPCLVPGSALTASPVRGECMALDVCLGAVDAGLPPFQCVWSDMTLVTRRPPAATCPAPTDPRAPFCLGACGAEFTCPAPSSPFCVGLSDSRGFGVCVYSPMPCYREERGLFTTTLDTCGREYGRPCVCMVLFPQAPASPVVEGTFVLADACLAYQAAYPGGVECRDRDWSLIPP